MTMEVSVIGTNRDLKSMQRIRNCRITALKQLASAVPEQGWISDRLTTLGRERIAVSATLVNRRTEAAKKVVDLSRWFNGNGAEFSVEATGLPDLTRQAVDCLAPGGACVLAGIAAADAEGTLRLNQLRLGRSVRGSLFGDCVPGLFIPRLVKLYRMGRFPVDRLVTEYGLENINQAADDILSGAAVKAVLMMP